MTSFISKRRLPYTIANAEKPYTIANAEKPYTAGYTHSLETYVDVYSQYLEMHVAVQLLAHMITK